MLYLPAGNLSKLIMSKVCEKWNINLHTTKQSNTKCQEFQSNCSILEGRKAICYSSQLDLAQKKCKMVQVKLPSYFQ